MQKEAKPGRPEVPAVGPTKKEFINFLNRAQEAFWLKLSTMPALLTKWVQLLGLPYKMGAQRLLFEGAKPPLGRLPSFWFPIWSWDRCSIHGGKGGEPLDAVLRSAGLPRAEFFDLPPRSGVDIHRIIEHVHARLVGLFGAWYCSDPQPYAVEAYKTVLQQIFYSFPGVASPEVIEAEVRKLPPVLQEVIAKSGGAVSKPFR